MRKTSPTVVVFASMLSQSACDASSNLLTNVVHEVSECGGFSTAASALLAESTAEDDSYECVESLTWSYIPDTQSLTVTDTCVSLNCCGDRSMRLDCDESGCVAHETDTAQRGKGRCSCDCDFDFRVTGSPVRSGPLSLTVMRYEEDEYFGNHLDTIWTGIIDLRDGSGTLDR